MVTSTREVILCGKSADLLFALLAGLHALVSPEDCSWFLVEVVPSNFGARDPGPQWWVRMHPSVSDNADRPSARAKELYARACDVASHVRRTFNMLRGGDE